MDVGVAIAGASSSAVAAADEELSLEACPPQEGASKRRRRTIDPCFLVLRKPGMTNGHRSDYGDPGSQERRRCSRELYGEQDGACLKGKSALLASVNALRKPFLPPV